MQTNKTTAKSIKLKPCLKCGATSIMIINNLAYKCAQCNSCGFQSGKRNSNVLAIDAWNKKEKV